MKNRKQIIKNADASETKNQIASSNYDSYNNALSAARYEGALLWQIFSVFLIIHTAIAGFVVQGIDANVSDCKDIRVLLGSMVGMALSFLWAATYARNATHYRYYLSKAREYEPKGWNIYGNYGADFSSGKVVTIGSERFRLSPVARIVRSGRMIPPVIFVFFLVYMLGLAMSIKGCIVRNSCVASNRTANNNTNLAQTNICIYNNSNTNLP